MWIKLPPALTEEEERTLALRMRSGDAEARARLIEGNLRFVMYVAWRNPIGWLTLEERFSNGCLGLIQAVDAFDPNRGSKLKNMISVCVQNVMLNELRHKRYHAPPAISLDYPIDADRTLGDVIPAQWVDPQEQMNDREDCRMAWGVIDGMPDDVRQYMRFRYGGEYMSQDAAAKKIGWCQMRGCRTEKAALAACRAALT